MVGKGQFVGLDWNRISQLHNQVMTSTYGTKAIFIQNFVESLICSIGYTELIKVFDSGSEKWGKMGKSNYS